MGNVVSYIKWRGDITFQMKPFNEVDNIVFSELSYLDFEGIVPEVGENKMITVSEAMEKFLNEEKEAKCTGGIDVEFIREIGRSKRFGNLTLCNCRDYSNLEGTDTDFAAIQINISEDTAYIAFRGTGNALIGWREDFSMSFQVMPAQRLAVTYLNDIFDDTKKYYVGGHSKGGNLALYASAMISQDKKEQVLQIYSNDGPGLCPEIIASDCYEGIRDKITRIVPEFSVIGALFEVNARTIIIRSSVKGVAQHDESTWLVAGDTFVTEQEHSEECNFYNEIIRHWIESADMEHRYSFTKDFFDALEASGASTMSDLSQEGIDDFLAILISITQESDKKTKNMLIKLAQTFFLAFKHVDIKKLVREKEIIQAMILFFLGIFIAGSPFLAVQFSGVAVGIVGVLFIGKRLLNCAFKEKGSITKRKSKIVVHMITMCIIMYLIAEKNILLQFSNLIIAAGFLLFAYRWMEKAFSFSKIFPHKIAGFFIAFVSFLMGMLPIVVNGLKIQEYMITIGALTWLYGVGTFIYLAYKNEKERQLIIQKHRSNNS